MKARPKALVVVPHMPYPLNSGGRIRIFESLKTVQNFAEIAVLMVYYSFQDLPGLFHLHRRFGEVIAARLTFDELRDENLPRVIAEFTSTYMEQAFQEALERFRPDLVHLHFAYTGACARLVNGIPLLLEEHNIEYDILQRSGLEDDYQALKKFEQQLWKQASHLIAVTERDRQMMLETVPFEKTSLLPNGVNSRHFQPATSAGELKFVFLGGLDYPPNQQAIRNFHDYVWPSLQPRRIPWYIIGSGVPGGLEFVHNDPHIKFLHNPPDVRPYLDSNAIMVVPLLVGGGSRLKVLTALAMGCPVVSTSLGCEGLEVADGKHVLLADTPDAMLEQVVRLIEDPQLRLELGRNGRQLAERLYDWQIVLQPLQSIYEKLLG